VLRPDVTPESFHLRQQGKLPGLYGLTVTHIAEGRMETQMAIQPWMHAPNGFLHAASVIMLADTCAGYACMAHLPAAATGFTTIELKSNFLGTAMEGVLRCEAVAEHLGRTTQVWSAVVFGPPGADGSPGRRMALFRCTQMVLW
jgi:uncharacterized protein (TIGR00369 family)